MELTIKNLEYCFNKALKYNANYFGIKVKFEDKGDRKSTRLNSSHGEQSRMPSSA